MDRTAGAPTDFAAQDGGHSGFGPPSVPTTVGLAEVEEEASTALLVVQSVPTVQLGLVLVLVVVLARGLAPAGQETDLVP